VMMALGYRLVQVILSRMKRLLCLVASLKTALSYRLGAIDYIAKPFHPPIVRVRVRNHMRLVQQRHLLEKLAALDGLTGIPNRRHFDETYLQEWRRCHRSGDIDPYFFKSAD